ncbi:hypothetical protein U9M48_009312 [Paspalum notatum var. saurae]|uniref:non-specific serine/threonine protein kinase n=1 Tax=Paspalum notatum var. saurae TaxID=547442 RepID=A0AAQ3SSE1_PASNO
MHASLSFLVLLLFHLHGLSHAEVPAAAAAAAGGGQFIYNGFAGAGLDLDGMAVVEPDGRLMLTNVTSQLKGHAFHPAPLRFHDKASAAAQNGTARSFSTTFVFAIVSDYVTVSGNGLAFFVAPSKNLSAASPSQFLGLFNNQNNGNATNHVFAVELDTILNPEFRDINSNHVGVDVNGLVSLAAEPAGYYADDDTGAFRNLSLFSGDAMQVWVDYDGRATALNVTLAPAEAPKPKKPLISVAVDLSAVVSDTAYVGLSSSTGPYRTRHYALGWSLALDGAAPPLDYAKLPKMPRAVTKRRPKALDVVLPVAMPLLALAAVAFVSLLAWRRFRYVELREDWEVEFGPHRFAYKDLFHATGGFAGKHLLGVGGFGRVYKGVLPASKTEVAVKIVSHDARQGMKQFVAEVVSIGRLRHRNVVPLLGYCRRKGELLLVYDYMPNGSLDRWLYDHGGAPPLSWAQRLHAIRGVAAGLLYLHEDWEQVVVHRDVKASNVLLDGEMNARLGDFGLARLYDRGAGPQTTHVVGTMGYLAPELAHTRRVTPASDVFAFGAFVLEVACGRRPIERGGGDDDDDGRFLLVDWVLELWHKGALADAVDARLCGDYDAEEAALVLKLGLLCSHPVPDARPSMRQVVQYLDGDAPLPEPPPSYQSFTALAMMQNEGFDSFAASYPSSSATVTSVGAVSSRSLLLLLVVVVHAAGAGDVEFAYNGFGGAGLSLDGMATVTPDGLLLLTNDTNMSKSHAFHREPVRFRRPGAGTTVSSFSTTFVFAIVSEFLDLSTSGFALLVSPTTDLSTAMPQQYLGMFNGTSNGDPRNHVFAVELDTVRNPEFADINNNHVGVDVNSLNSSAAAPAGYLDDATAAFRNLSLISRDPMQLWLDYDAATAVVTVAMAPARQPRPRTPLISAKINLSNVITDTAYVGFSSASSVVLVKHYVVGWSFRLGGGGAAPALDYDALPKLPRFGPKPRSKALTVALPIATTSAVLAAVAVGFVFLRRRRRYAELRADWEVEFGPHRFAYKDLYDATDGFKGKHLLGAGGFGRVYKGVLPGSRTEVAVKKVSHESRQGMKEFVAEVVSIGRLRHRNLVQLLGYCRRKGELLLVYDYMPNGSLDKHLHVHDGDGEYTPVLDWDRRLHVIRGVAAGLLYMHEDWEKVVVHRDIKASNVLLDGEMNGRLGDFGLARLYDHGSDPQTTHVVGTMGYLAPELVRTGKATTLSDVFAFGAFLLEVACGRRPIEEEDAVDAAAIGGDRFVLADWVLGHWRKGSITGAVDARLGSEYEPSEADLVLRLGLACLHPSPAVRPSMRQVTQYLDGSAPLPELPATYVTYDMFAGMEKYQALFDSWSVRRSTGDMSIATMSDISLSCGR